MRFSNWLRQIFSQSLSLRLRESRSVTRRREQGAVREQQVLECLEARILLTSDFGDAADTTLGTGIGDYRTLSADNGPSHFISTTQTTLFLGASVDGEADASASSRANGDDITSLPNDEDGLIEPAQDLVLTVGTASVVRVRATNTTGTTATLYGWIDYNRDGVFDNSTERTSVSVPTSTSNGTFTLTFPTIPTSIVAGATYARFRLSTDVAAANSTGAATDGEVEDYAATIFQRSNSTVASSVKIASGTNGSPTLGDSDRFGRSVAALGDLDGDGVTDLAVGAFADNAGDGERGAVSIQFMNSNGTVKSFTKIASDVNGGPTLANGDSFGSSIASLGDVDGDGVTDLAVGASGDDTDGTDRGAVHVLLLNANGAVKSSFKVTSGLNGGATLANGDLFGVSLASSGDLDGDGVVDLAIGARNDGTGSGDQGAVYIQFMNADGTVKSFTKIASATNGGPTLANGDSFLGSVTSLGDLDGDGVTDLAVGAITNDTDDTEGTKGGAVHVLFLNADGSVKNSVKIASWLNGGPVLNNDEDNFGTSVTSLGDLDGDGVTDLAVGAAGDDTGGDHRGSVHVLLLNSNGSVKSSTKIASDTNGGPTLTNIDAFGISVASLGDMNGDGVTDLAVGAHGDDTEGTDRGSVHILFLDALNVSNPVFTSSASQTVEENTTAVATLTATDADLPSQTVSFAITGGADSARFSITSGGVLTFVEAPNFEIPADTDANNTYDVQVTATDSGTPALTIVQNLTITVSDVNELLTLTSGTTGSIAENEAVSNVVYTAIAIDPDTTAPNNNISYSIKPDVDDAAYVTINETTGAVTLLASADFESKSSYLFTVVATDGGSPALSAEKAVTVYVFDQPEGTVLNDAFVLTYSDSSVAITLATNGEVATSLGTFPLDAPLTLFGLDGDDSVRIVGTRRADTFTVNSTGLTANEASLVLTSIENRTLAGMAGSDIYKFDADESLGLFTLDETGSVAEDEADGGIDTIDLSLTTTADFNLSLDLGTAAAQVVHVNLSLELGSSATFENIVGGSGNDTLTGNSLANTLTGNAGNDTLAGGIGDDSLDGGLGDDTYVFATATTAEAELDRKYQAWVATLTPARQAWEALLQAELGSFYLPIHKREKVAGKSNAWDFVEDDPALPRILLIGDSISRAYTQKVREELAGIANVHRAPANCGPTSNGLNKMDVWLGDGKWDLIHFNFGIHDRETPLANYATRLEQLVERLKQTDAKLVWASSTPIPDVTHKYSAESIVQRNAVAADLMQEHEIDVSDLFTAITPRLAEMQIPNDVHFFGPGNEFLGSQVATFLKSIIPNLTPRLNAAGVFGKIVSGSGNNTPTGGSGNNSPGGRSGDDNNVSKVEADTVTEAANAGTDTLSFSSLTTNVILSLETTAVQMVHSNRTLKLNMIDVFENIVGGSGNDTLTGNSLANTLRANAGNDRLVGGGGDDSLVGGSGDDTYVFETATMAEADTVTEGTRAGTDTLSFSSLTTDVTLALATTLVQTVHANRTLKLNAASVFEEIVGGSGNDTLAGNSLANTLRGGPGDDKLNGTTGSDQLFGGLDNDTYLFGSSSVGEADQVYEDSGGGLDTLSFAAQATSVMLHLGSTAIQAVHTNRTLKLNSVSTIENAIGGTANDTLTGNDLNNILAGGSGNDTLNGTTGSDQLFGGLDHDTYTFGAASVGECDQITETENGGLDTLNFVAQATSVTLHLGSKAIQSVHTNRTLKLNSDNTIENAVGGSANDMLTGNGLGNNLTGGTGNDRLNGTTGSDQLFGGPDNDTYLFGAASAGEVDQVNEYANSGIDTLNFSAQSISVFMNLGSNTIQTVHTNRDLRLLSGITVENLVGGSASDTLIGNSLNNTLSGGNGDDILVALSGHDILEAGNGRDILISGLGRDALNGGAGDDILIAGCLSSDTSLTSLNTLQTEWISTNNYATRIANLRTGVGNLSVSLKTTINMLNDADEEDLLTGGANTDWYIRALDDFITDWIAGEIEDVL
jgi:Ca2+-binding RTX toxin-like protein